MKIKLFSRGRTDVISTYDATFLSFVKSNNCIGLPSNPVHPPLAVDELKNGTCLTLILQRSRTGTVWFYTATSNKRAARPKLYTKSLSRDLKRMYSRFTLVRISIKL